MRRNTDVNPGVGRDPAKGARSRILLERERELDSVSKLLERTAGGRGAVLLIRGPAGIGKTSMLEACAQLANDEGLATFSSRGDELVMGSSFAAVRELLVAGVDPVGTEMWDGAARLAAPVFHPVQGQRLDRDLVASVLHGLYWVVAGLAERNPSVLIVDDAQWLDPASARFIAYLARRISSLAALLVVAVRSGEEVEAGATLAELATSELRLAPLSTEGSEALIRGRLGARADEELCRSCHQATGGNPFYLLQLTAALEAEAGRPTAALAKRVRELGAGTIGETVLARLARLGPDCERVAQSVAVLGSGCRLRHAAELARLTRERAEAAADRLRAADLLAPGQALMFVHPIVGDALIAQLPHSRRGAMHGKAAAMLLADGVDHEQACVHLLSAEPYEQPWVVDALRTAAGDAVARGAPELAVDYLRRALAEPPGAEDRLEVLVELGRAESLAPFASDYAALRQALALAEDPQRRAQIAYELALALFGVVRSREGLAVIERTLVDEQLLGAQLVELLESALIAGGLDYLPATPMLLERAARHFDAARRGEPRDPRMLAALAVIGAVTGMPAQDVERLALSAVADERLLSDWLDDGYATATYALCLTDCLDDATRLADAGVAEAQRRGLASIYMQLLAIRAEIGWRAGDLDRSQADSERAIELGRELDADHYALLQWLPPVLIERGDVVGALTLLDSVQLTESELDGSFAVTVLAHRGRARVAAGQLEAGLADLLDADRRQSAAGWQLSIGTSWVSSAVQALVGLGRVDDARRLAERELAQAAAFGAARRHGIALSVSGVLDEADHGLEQLQSAVDVLARSGARLEHARALANLGAGLRVRRHLAEARRVLSQALAAATACGATAVGERARSELLASGARPRRAVVSGPDALTPAELRTARMAAGGLSNREIAQALFLTTKTIEAQLSQAYTKLAVAGRADLPQALGRAHPGIA